MYAFYCIKALKKNSVDFNCTLDVESTIFYQLYYYLNEKKNNIKYILEKAEHMKKKYKNKQNITRTHEH